MSGIERIAKERQRQIEVEGWGVDHDDHNDSGELPSAAACYSLMAASQAEDQEFHPYDQLPNYWPWNLSWWKPSPDPIRNLEKAGALIAAEIDRLERVRANGSEAG